MRSRMSRANDSFHDSHGYTPLWQVSTSCQRGQLVHSSTYRSSSATSVSRTSSSGAARTRLVDEVEAAFEPNLDSQPQLASSRALPVPALHLYARRESHDCCPPFYAGGALDMSTFHPERAASSPAALDAPRGPIRSEGGCGGGRGSPAGARGRTARDVLDTEGRARAAWLPPRSERRARAPRRAASVRVSSRSVVGLYSVLVASCQCMVERWERVV
jgi:hypothetical protein